MKQLFLKSNLLHIRTNEGEFEVSNPEEVGRWDGHHLLLFILNPPLRSASNNGLITTGDTCEWPGGVELIESCIKGSCAEANECIQPHYCVAKKLARLIPEEKKDLFDQALDKVTPEIKEQVDKEIDRINSAHSFTESAYKEVDKPEPCAYEEECQHPACNCGKMIEPFNKECPKCRTKDFASCHSMHCPVRKPVSAPSESQEDFAISFAKFCQVDLKGRTFNDLMSEFKATRKPE